MDYIAQAQALLGDHFDVLIAFFVANYFYIFEILFILWLILLPSVFILGLIKDRTETKIDNKAWLVAHTALSIFSQVLKIPTIYNKLLDKKTKTGNELKLK